MLDSGGLWPLQTGDLVHGRKVSIGATFGTAWSEDQASFSRPWDDAPLRYTEPRIPSTQQSAFAMKTITIEPTIT